MFPFADVYYGLASKTNSTVLQLQSTLGQNLFNELIVNYTTIRDNRTVPDTLFPQVNVLVAGGYRLTAGTEQYSGANSLDQNILEITDNVTWTLGKHMLTIGTHNEFFKFANVYIRNLYGYWEFSSLDNFENGISSRYYHDFYTADPTEKWAPEFSVAQLGGYIGDKWAVRDNLFLTLGARVDVPFINKIPTANAAAEAAYGVPTDQVASGNVMFSPRVGFNWDVRGDKTTQVRGGVGLFSGRTPYVWISNQYSNTGMEFTRLDIRNPAFAFESDPLNQPAGGTGLTSEVDLIDSNFMYPQSLRGSLAVDQELPYGIIGTVEFVASKNVNEILYQNLNVRRLDDLGMGDRYLYARDVSSLFTDAIYLTNTNKGHQYSLSVQLQKNFSDRSWVNAFYSYGQSKDVNSGTSSQASSNFAYNNDPLRRQRSRADLVQLRRAPSLRRRLLLAAQLPAERSDRRQHVPRRTVRAALFDDLQLLRRQRRRGHGQRPGLHPREPERGRLRRQHGHARGRPGRRLGVLRRLHQRRPRARRLPRPDRAAQLEPRAGSPHLGHAHRPGHPHADPAGPPAPAHPRHHQPLQPDRFRQGPELLRQQPERHSLDPARLQLRRRSRHRPDEDPLVGAAQPLRPQPARLALADPVRSSLQLRLSRFQIRSTQAPWPLGPGAFF